MGNIFESKILDENDKFICLKNGYPIPNVWLCDGFVDCPYGEGWSYEYRKLIPLRIWTRITKM